MENSGFGDFVNVSLPEICHTSNLPNMTPQDIVTHCDDCIKLAVNNKINAKNAFHLHLIEFLPVLMNETDFQSASCSLDAGAKIYASRVDAIHKETFKVISLLGQTIGADSDGEDDAEDVNANEITGSQNVPPPPKLRKSISNSRKKFIISQNLSKIRLPAVTRLFDIDPLFQQQARIYDEGGTACLHLNCLNTHRYPSEFILDGETKFLHKSPQSVDWFALEATSVWQSTPGSTHPTASSHFASLLKKMIFHSQRDPALFGICPEYEHFFFTEEAQDFSPSKGKSFPNSKHQPMIIHQKKQTHPFMGYGIKLETIVIDNNLLKCVNPSSMGSPVHLDDEDNDDDAYHDNNYHHLDIDYSSARDRDDELRVDTEHLPEPVAELTGSTMENNLSSSVDVHSFVQHLHEINQSDDHLLFGAGDKQLVWKNCHNQYPITSTPLPKRVKKVLETSKRESFPRKTKFSFLNEKKYSDDPDELSSGVHTSKSHARRNKIGKVVNMKTESSSMVLMESLLTDIVADYSDPIEDVIDDDDGDTFVMSPIPVENNNNNIGSSMDCDIDFSMEVKKISTVDSGLGLDSDDTEFFSPPKKMMRISSSNLMNSANQIDVKRLKVVMRGIVELHTEATFSPVEAPVGISTTTLGCLTFSTLLEQMSTQMGVDECTKVTSPVVFSCLLQLANDMNLVIESAEDGLDLKICHQTHPESDPNLQYILQYASQYDQGAASEAESRHKRCQKVNWKRKKRSRLDETAAEPRHWVDIDCSDGDEI